MSIIKTENLSYVYGQKSTTYTKALKNINIEVNKGEILGIIGHTGSGKSTLVQLLNGLLEPSSGRVLINGCDIKKSKEKRLNVKFEVGLVFQYPEHQLFEETVKKDIAFGPKNMGLEEDEIERRIHKAINLVGIKEDILDKSPFELSGGQMRRVAIAGVIAMEPNVLIMDEPSAGLDPQGKRNIFNMIKNYHETTKKTILLVSHSMEDMANYADRILILNKGEVYKIDKTENIFKDSQELKKIGLNVPQICDVFHRLKEDGFNFNENIYTVEKAVEEIKSLIKNRGTKDC